MLEVMNAGSTEFSRPGGDHGILLNCWNKSSPLIRELERTVSFAERKCGDLMQQLHFYKEYYEKWAQFERVNHLSDKKKVKKCCRQTLDFGSSSENEFEKANQYFCRKIKSKINEMNNEIIQANRKINSRSENFPPFTKKESPREPEARENPREPPEPPSLAIANKTCKSEPAMASSDVADVDVDGEGDAEGVKVTGKQSSKSVPARNRISKNAKKDSGPSKKRYANLQRYKIRSKSLPQGVSRKFGFGGFFEVFETDAILKNEVKSSSKSRTSLKAESSKSHRSRKSKTRLVEARKPTPKSSRFRVARSKSDVRQFSRSGKRDSEPKKRENPQGKSAGSPKAAVKEANAGAKEANACTAIVPSGRVEDVAKAELFPNGNLRNLIAKPSALLPFLRNPIPFIPCSSTSKSFNLGLNVQQVLSLIKRKRHSVTLQAIVRSSVQAARSATEPTVNTLFISQTTTSHSHVTSAICPAREGSEDGLSVAAEGRSKCSVLRRVQTLRSRDADENPTRGGPPPEFVKPERPEDVWVVEQPDASSGAVGNPRSRCTCFPTSKHCVDYNKVLRQYTGWRPSPEPPTSFPCAESKLFAVPPADGADFGGGESGGRTELAKVHNDLLNLTRKYSSLQKQISQNGLDDYEANAELDAMESELALKEIEFKDIINFYNQLTMLREKLKSLRSRIGQSQSAARQQEGQRPKKNPPRPTPSMALAKVLKKIQGLQDKIKLIDAP